MKVVAGEPSFWAWPKIHNWKVATKLTAQEDANLRLQKAVGVISVKLSPHPCRHTIPNPLEVELTEYNRTTIEGKHYFKYLILNRRSKPLWQWRLLQPSKMGSECKPHLQNLVLGRTRPTQANVGDGEN